MKNYIKYIIMLVSITVLFTSCEDLTSSDLGMDSQWIQFEKSSDLLLENSTNPLQIPILYAADENTSDIQVSFTYTASQQDGFTIEPANGIVTIPAGEFIGYITLTPIDDLIAGEDITIEFSIEGNSGMNVGIAGEGIYNTKAVITIVEDDCPIDLDEWVGVYSVQEVFTGPPNAPFNLAYFFNEVYQVELAKDPSDVTGTKVILTNSIGFNIYFYDGTVMSFLTCSQEVNFDAGNPVLADFTTFDYTTSAFNPDAYSITCSGPLTGYGDYEFVLTKL